MKPFNCLSANCSVFGPHLLEASAGTGKTFSIEHVFVRFLLESDIEVEQILAVTFTKAATRDLKKRIRANIEAALERIQSGKKGWDYLDPYLGSVKAADKLRDASLAFDESHIYTIHAFCYRMLQEFAFEADLGVALRDPEQEIQMPKRFFREAKRFLEQGIGPELLCPEQMSFLLKKYEDLDALIRSLVNSNDGGSSVPFSVLVQRYASLWPGKEVDEAPLLETFRTIRTGYKAMPGDFEAQLKALAESKEHPDLAFRKLLRARGTLFSFLAPSNRKVRAKVDCPPFLEWARSAIEPLIAEAMDRKKIFKTLQEAWRKVEEPLLLEEQWFGFDEILRQMREAIERESFSEKIRQKFEAVIIDEFQDTDPLQWEIFRELFLKRAKRPRAFYLVGDPKQSIYRFRKADIYTYFEAREQFGPSAQFCLDTNYRSSSSMIDALNSLFDRNWLALPKLGQMIPSPAVKSQSDLSSDFQDEKGAVHFLVGRSFEEDWLPYAVQEIERLFPVLRAYSSFAILVKDRYQAERALRTLQERSIPAMAKSCAPLGKTLAFQAVRELIEAIASPRDNSLRRIVGVGPFRSLSLPIARTLLESEGLASLCRQIVNCGDHDPDLKQVLEELLAWEGRAGFSLQGLVRHLSELESLDPEEGGRRKLETDVDAVQILTMHISKGLEFDIVFAIGLATRPPESEEAEEADAEKLRQLYVAMTRAKRRLYVPLSTVKNRRGSPSPMELFCQTIEAQEGDLLSFLKKSAGITCETIPETGFLPPIVVKRKEPSVLSFLPPEPPLAVPCFIQSFTSLAQQKTKEISKEAPSSPLFTPHTIPKGTETGILIHQIFEKLFSCSAPLWNNAASLASIVAEQVDRTPLLPWANAIQEMIWKTLHLPLPLGQPFTLSDLLPGQLQVEMEFLYSSTPHFVKGFIDLVFQHEGKLYFVDWKTNWLGPDDTSYLALDPVMTECDYWLQAKIYAEALRRHVKQFYMDPFEEIFGGALYIFLRGGGVCHFTPDLGHG